MGHVWERKRNRETWTKVFIFLFKAFKEWLDYTRILTKTKEHIIRRYTPMWWMLLLRFEIDKGLVISKR